MPFEVIAHGFQSIQVPGYLTVNTGKHSADPEKIHIILEYGNTTKEIGLFPWVKMHGVRVTYRKHGSLKRTTVHDDNSVTMLVTGEWKVEAEKPG